MLSSRNAAAFLVWVLACVATYGILPSLVSAADQICPADRVYTLKCGEKEKDAAGKETGKIGGLDCACTETENEKTVTGLCKPKDGGGKCFGTETAEGEKPRQVTPEELCRATIGCDPSLLQPKPDSGQPPPVGGAPIPNATPQPNPTTDPKPTQENTDPDFLVDAEDKPPVPEPVKNEFDKQIQEALKKEDECGIFCRMYRSVFGEPAAITPPPAVEEKPVSNISDVKINAEGPGGGDSPIGSDATGFNNGKNLTDPFVADEAAALNAKKTPAELAAEKIDNYVDNRSYMQKLKDQFDTGDLYSMSAWAKDGDQRDKDIIKAAYEKLYAAGYTDKDLANLRNDPKKLAAVQNAFFEAASEAGRIHPAFKNDKQYFFEHLNARYTQESTCPSCAVTNNNGSGIAQLTAPAIQDVWGIVRNDARTDDTMNVLTGAAFENKIGVDKNHDDPYSTSLVYKGRNNGEFVYADKVEARTNVFSKAFETTLAGGQPTIGFDDRFDSSSRTAAEWRDIVAAQSAYLVDPAPINNANGGFAEYNEIFEPPTSPEAKPFNYGLAGQDIEVPYTKSDASFEDLDAGNTLPLAYQQETPQAAPVAYPQGSDPVVDAETTPVVESKAPTPPEEMSPIPLDPALQEKAPPAVWPPPIQTRAPVANIPPTDVIGDSLGDGLKAAGKLPGDTMRNRTTSQVLEVAEAYVEKFDGDLTGKHVVVSSGCSNSPKQCDLVAETIEVLQDAGAKVTVVGVGTRSDLAPLNARIAAIAQQMGADFQAVKGVGKDGVHPGAQGYADTLAAISAKAQTLVPASTPPLTAVANTFPYAESAKYFGNSLPTNTWQPAISDTGVFAYTPPDTGGFEPVELASAPIGNGGFAEYNEIFEPSQPSVVLQEAASPQKFSMLGTDNPVQGTSGGLLDPVADKSVFFDSSSISQQSLQPYSAGITLDDFDDYAPVVTPPAANAEVLAKYPPIDFDSEPFPVTQTSAPTNPPVVPEPVPTDPPATLPPPMEGGAPKPLYLESQQLFGPAGDPITPEQLAKLNQTKGIVKEPDVIATKTITGDQPPNVAKAEKAVDDLQSRVNHMKTVLNNAVATGQIDWLKGVKAIHSAQTALSEANKTIAGLKGTDSDFAEINAASKSLTETSTELNKLKVALATYSTSAVVDGMQKHGAEMTKSMNNAANLVQKWSNALPSAPTSVETIVTPGKSYSYDIPVMSGGGESFLYADAPTTFGTEPSAASKMAYTWDPDGPSGEFFEYEPPASSVGSNLFTGPEPIELATAPTPVAADVEPTIEDVSASQQQLPVPELIAKDIPAAAPPTFDPPTLDDWAAPQNLDERPVQEYGPLVTNWAPRAPTLAPAIVAAEPIPPTAKSGEPIVEEIIKPRSTRGFGSGPEPLPNTEPITGPVPLPKPAPFKKDLEPVNPTIGSTGYGGSSLVDYLKSAQLETSFASRRERWAEMVQAGQVSGRYTGTAKQNRLILRSLRGY